MLCSYNLGCIAQIMKAKATFNTGHLWAQVYVSQSLQFKATEPKVEGLEEEMEHPGDA